MIELMSLRRVSLADSALRPHLDFVLPGLLVQTVGMIVGQGAIGKSILAIQTGLSIATGRQILGGLWKPQKKGAVTVIMGEDDIQILKERLYWIRKHEQLSKEQIEDAEQNLFIYSTFGMDMRLIVKTSNGFQHGPFHEVLKHYCKNQRLVIIDPLLFLIAGLDENDNSVAAVLMNVLQQLTLETGCTIVLVHHIGKSNGDREEWASARGASALTTCIRWQMKMTPPSIKEVGEFKLDDKSRRERVRVALIKVNYGKDGSLGWLNRRAGGVLEFMNEPTKCSAKPAVSLSQSNEVAEGGYNNGKW
jgi:RecA-family ATPase